MGSFREDVADEEVSGLGAPEDMEKVLEVTREESGSGAAELLLSELRGEEAATLPPPPHAQHKGPGSPSEKTYMLVEKPSSEAISSRRAISDTSVSHSSLTLV